MTNLKKKVNAYIGYRLTKRDHIWPNDGGREEKLETCDGYDYYFWLKKYD